MYEAGSYYGIKSDINYVGVEIDLKGACKDTVVAMLLVFRIQSWEWANTPLSSPLVFVSLFLWSTDINIVYIIIDRSHFCLCYSKVHSLF
jgi:hypothetical protein